jgi:hypothetical protein
LIIGANTCIAVYPDFIFTEEPSVQPIPRYNSFSNTFDIWASRHEGIMNILGRWMDFWARPTAEEWQELSSSKGFHEIAREDYADIGKAYGVSGLSYVKSLVQKSAFEYHLFQDEQSLPGIAISEINLNETIQAELPTSIAKVWSRLFEQLISYSLRSDPSYKGIRKTMTGLLPFSRLSRQPGYWKESVWKEILPLVIDEGTWILSRCEDHIRG